MKNLLLLLVSFILGFLGYWGFHMWQVNNQRAQIISQVKKQEEKFDIAVPPKESKIGAMVAMSGDVKWQSRVATEPASIISPVPIKQGEKLVTGDNGNLVVNFEGVGTLTISPKADIAFVQTLPIDFVVNQTAGEIGYNPSGDTPISIRIPHLLVQIKSGSLRVSIDDKTPTVHLSMLRGGATVAFNDINNVSTVFDLKQGKTYIFNGEDRTLTE